MGLKNCLILRFIVVSSLIFLFSSPLLAQSRGIKIVAVDDATQEWQEISLYGKTHAVIIGIDRYPKLLSEQQLTYAVSDAKAVERMLRGKFVFNQIYTLYDEQATKSNIEDILLNKLSVISKNDAVFVFFAGHGGQEKTDYGDIGYIVPYDGNFTDMRKVISMTTIRDDISKRIKAKHVFYVMDACYSGLLVVKRGKTLKETRRDITYLKQITKEPVRQVLTAGDANQQVLDGGPNGHSVFTGRFLETLNSADDFITAEEISYQVKEKVLLERDGKRVEFKLIDTPGIATKIDFEDFMKFGLKKKAAQDRAKEATQGIIESIKWLDDMDAVIVLIDATMNPYSQVNITIIGNLVARKIPVLIVANKIDLKKADIKKVQGAFPEYDVVGISAKNGDNMDEFYEELFKLVKRAK